jgi:hypothetical protein
MSVLGPTNIDGRSNMTARRGVALVVSRPTASQRTGARPRTPGERICWWVRASMSTPRKAVSVAVRFVTASTSIESP